MFSFLTRLGRLFVVTLVFGTVATILGFGVLNYSPVASKHHGSAGSSGSAACSMSPATVGGALVISGSGYSAGGSYTVRMTWPYGGVGDLMTTASTSGTISVTTRATWAGTYKADVLSSRGAVVASCSETV